MEVGSFSAIEEEFMARVQKVVWCNLASIDRKNRVRSRIVHPGWEHSTGWVTTRRDSFKGKHLKHSPCVSVTYVDAAKPLYADCVAEWDDNLADKQRIWDLCKSLTTPLGFDPAPIYQSFDHPNFGLIRLIPWRIELNQFPAEPRIWRASE
jgi:general stress protein 26